MIKSITVTNYLGDSIKLELTNPESSGFIVKSVTGLGPGSATINTSEISTTDGSIINSARIPSRNIVLSLLLMFKDTVEDVRHLSYKYFPIKKKLTLEVETDSRKAKIDGYVESNDPNIFSSEEGSDISIICPDPFFYDSSTKQTVSFSSVEPAFEFPFSNESLTEPLLEFSKIIEDLDRVIFYEGDYEVGVTISVQALGEATDISFYNVDTQESMTIYTDVIEAITGAGITDKDEIVICTVRGRKSAKLIREGTATDILNAVDKDSDWFQLQRGDNRFAYTAETGRANLRVTIENDIIYEGV